MNADGAASISKAQFDENRRCKLQLNDLVVAIGGYIGNAAVVVEPCQAVIGQHSAVLPEPEKAGADSRFLVAYLNCRFAEAIFSRYVSGTVQAGINLEDLRDLPAPAPQAGAQKYIGDKVRQAERLRAWAKKLHAAIQSKFEVLLGGNYDKTESLFERVKPDLLSDRLDQNHYRRPLLNCLKLLSNVRHVALSDTTYFSELTDGDHGNPKYGSGPIYLRASEISGGLISLSDVVTVDYDYADTISKSCWAKPGEVIFSVVGTLGLTAIVDEQTTGVMSRGIAKIKSNILPNYYVKAFFKTEYFQAQLERHSVGSVQRGVYLSALERIIVPVFDEETHQELAALEGLADGMVRTSRSLTQAAKLLVEALIEGQIDESLLIAAQNELQAGNDTLDRTILNRLKTDGIDGAGPPLFADLDQLYSLLAQAEQA